MPQVIQKTKLFIPSARAKSVERPRLLHRIDRLLDEVCRVAVVSAPAGFGKTTLVVQWLVCQEIPTAWLSLDERDNLPACFFSYLFATLQPIVPNAGDEAQSLLELPGVSIEEIVTLLTNDLVESPGPFILVLDDFHVITNPLLHQAMDLLIEAQPPQMRLVLLSREDPGIQLARRRACGELIEIRQSDLAFTMEEAAAFVKQNMALQLTDEQVYTLETRTEGWAAGLQLASLAMQALDPAGEPFAGQPGAHIDRFLQNLSGSHRFILDYLMEEVLSHQPEAVQTFLLETSILDRLQADLCALVTGRSLVESQKLLEQIAHANLFVISLDSERRWYRYHHLFGDLLLARLQAERPQDVAGLYLRTSKWYEANGDPRQAVEYALKAEAYQQAANLIERHITERWQTVDVEFLRLVNRLPFEVIAERPGLCLQSAWLCVMNGQTAGILPLVEASEQALGQAGDRNAAVSRAFAHTLRAYVADMQNQPVAVPGAPDGALEQAYRAIPETNPGMHNSVGVVIGMISFMEGDFASAMRYYEDALALDKRVNGTNAVPIATIRLCFVLQAQGRLREAMRRLQESEGYMHERGIRRFYISGSLFQRMADILLEWNQLPEADHRILEGSQLLEDWPMPTTRNLGRSLLVRLHVARGDLAAAREALAQADRNARETGLHPYFLDVLERARLCLLLAEQDQTALEVWARENESYRERPLSFRYETRQVELCRAWLAIGRQADAIHLLERLKEAARDRNGSRINILTLLAAARAGQPEKALIDLDEALRLAEPEGYLRTFLEVSKPLAQVLRLWLQQGRSRNEPGLFMYAQTILSAFHSAGAIVTPRAAAPVKLAADLAEQLSLREQEVLALIAKGLSNRQIAERLVISVRTVKKHVENIHGKLGAQNRTQAVARARELRLID